MIKLTIDEIDDLSTKLESLLFNCFTDGSSPGCDCGCGGNTTDYSAEERRLEQVASGIADKYKIDVSGWKDF